jgi:hypothetical protein
MPEEAADGSFLGCTFSQMAGPRVYGYVSVSGWADFAMIGEMLGDRYVYSRKPTPACVDGSNPDWKLVERDMKKTCAATKGYNLEIPFRGRVCRRRGPAAPRGLGGHDPLDPRDLSTERPVVRKTGV